MTRGSDGDLVGRGQQTPAKSGNNDTLVGDVLGDRYQLVEVIGGGGMGVVYRARDRRLEDRLVAIKILVPSGDLDSDAAVRFGREAKIMGRLSHPNLVSILDTGQLADGRPFIVMEHLIGENLAQRIKRSLPPVDEIVEVLSQVAAGLDAAHAAGVVHRDLKPHNVFLCPGDGGALRIKVLDFGISKLVGSMTMRTETTQIVGTPQYMAPEQARGEHELTSPRSDVFALGVIAYEMVSGVRPFDGQMLHEVIFKIIDHHPAPLAEIADVADELSDAVLVAMAKEPRHRFASAGAFVRALTGQEPIEPETLSAITESAELPTVNARPRAGGADAGTVDTDNAAPVAKPAPTADVAAPAAAARRRRNRAIAGAVAVIAAVAAVAAVVLWRARSDIDPSISDLRRAYEIGDAGRSLFSSGRSREGLAELARAYRGGDRRLATRIALRHAMGTADALARTIEGSLIESGSVSESGDRVVVADSSVVKIYELESGRMLASRPIEREGPIRVAFSADDDEILVEDKAGVSIFDARLEREITRLDRALVIFVLPDDAIVIVRRVEQTTLVYERRRFVAADPDWTFRCEAPWPLSQGWSINVDKALIAVCPGSAVVLDLETGAVVQRPDRRLESLLLAGARLIARSGDDFVLYPPSDRGSGGGAGDGGALVAAASRPKYGRGGKGPDSREPVLVALPKSIGIAQASHDGTMVAVASGERVEIVRVEATALVPLATHLAAAEVTVLQFDERGRLAFGDATGLVRVVDAQTGVEILRGEQLGRVDSVRFNGANRLVSMSRGHVRVWDLARTPRTLLDRGEFDSVRVAGDVLVVSGKDGLAMSTGAEPPVTLADPAPRQWLLSRSGSHLVTGVEVIDTASGHRVPLPGRFAATTLSDRAELISGELGGVPAVLVREAAGYRALEVGTGPTDVRVSPGGGRYVALFGESPPRRIEVRDLAGEVLAASEGQGAVIAYFLSEDIIATLLVGGAELWRWRTGERNRISGVKFPLLETGGSLALWLDAGIHRVDLQTLQPAGVERPCATPIGPWPASPDLVLVSCGGNLVLWSLADRREVLVSRGVALFGASIDREGRVAAALTRSGALLRYDLTPEDRSPAEIDRAIDRLNGL